MSDTQRIAQGKRLRLIRDKFHLKQIDMAKMLNMHQASYSKAESGASFLSIEKLKIISERLNVPTDYFILGTDNDEIPIVNDKYMYDKNISSVHEPHISYANESFTTKHILAPIPANAGISIHYTQDWIDQNPEYLLLPNILQPSVTFEVAGDSMEPDFKDHDYVVTNKVDRIELIRSGMVVVIVTPEGIYLKVYKIENESIYLLSLNTLYSPISIKLSDIKAIYRPIQKITRYP